jgi:hypothetical protein
MLVYKGIRSVLASLWLKALVLRLSEKTIYTFIMVKTL